jgi:asparaginyl-tRNA synthetase
MRKDRVLAGALAAVTAFSMTACGGQREDNLEKLEARMDELGLKKEDYGFYLDLRKYGSARHSGFGLGFERCVMYLTGVSNIRDVIPFPRTVNNCEL